FILFCAAVGWTTSVPTANQPAGYPDWWFEREVIEQTGSGTDYAVDYVQPDDYAAVNQGQLKHMARAAYDELQQELPASVWTTPAGQALSALIASWYAGGDLSGQVITSGTDHYAVANTGQVKWIAKHHYDVLASVGYVAGAGYAPAGWSAGSYPWTDVTSDDDHYAAANLGQVKYLFSFDLSIWTPAGIDSDMDGLPDAWEQQIIDTAASDADPGNDWIDTIEEILPQDNPLSIAGDFDGDGIDNATEFSDGTDPVYDHSQHADPKFFSAVLANVSDNWQTVNLPASYTEMVVVATPVYQLPAAPAVVRVRNAGGNSLELKVQHPGEGSSVGPLPVHLVVLEAGVYARGLHGINAEAVRFSSSVTDRHGSWKGEPLAPVHNFTSPVVLGQVMSANDADWSVFWASGTSRHHPPVAEAIQVGKHVAEDSDQTRADETLGVIILEAGSGQLSGIEVQAGLGSESVRGLNNPLVYPLTGLSQAEVAVLASAGMDGGNGGWPVLVSPDPLSVSGVRTAIDEDTIKDSERNHNNTEQLAYLIVATDGFSQDSDSDGLPDDWEQQIIAYLSGLGYTGLTVSDILGSDPTPGDGDTGNDYLWDADGDDFSNLEEYQHATNPADASDPAPPAAPDSLTATEQQDGSVVLAWNDNSDNETSFLIEVSEDGGSSWSPAALTPANVTTLTIAAADLGDASSARFRITASGLNGNNTPGSGNAGTGTTTVIEPNEDWDGDGLTNQQEQIEYGTDPGNRDTDGDGQHDPDNPAYWDGTDGWPHDPNFHHPRASENYVLIDLSAPLPYPDVPSIQDDGYGLFLGPVVQIDDRGGVMLAYSKKDSHYTTLLAVEPEPGIRDRYAETLSVTATLYYFDGSSLQPYAVPNLNGRFLICESINDWGSPDYPGAGMVGYEAGSDFAIGYGWYPTLLRSGKIIPSPRSGLGFDDISEAFDEYDASPFSNSGVSLLLYNQLYDPLTGNSTPLTSSFNTAAASSIPDAQFQGYSIGYDAGEYSDGSDIAVSYDYSDHEYHKIGLYKGSSHYVGQYEATINPSGAFLTQKVHTDSNNPDGYLFHPADGSAPVHIEAFSRLHYFNGMDLVYRYEDGVNTYSLDNGSTFHPFELWDPAAGALINDGFTGKISDQLVIINTVRNEVIPRRRTRSLTTV
ncbi:MAG: hypothetical protein AAF649_11890, partial [Verrucomicrobiota bacterium]